MSRAKGNRIERKAEDYWEEKGFITDKKPHTQYQDQDFFSLFDILAVKPGEKFKFIQVKTNGANGINKFADEVREKFPFQHADYYYQVWYDYKGWRLIKIERDERTVVLDER